MNSDVFSAVALSIVVAAVVFYVLYLVVRAAVLDALRRNREEVNETREEQQ